MTPNTSKPYSDIPGTPVFDGDSARKGFHLNQFCMSLMTVENRERFLNDERAYLADWPMTDDQKEALIARDYTRLVALGGNIYFLVKLGATDGRSALGTVSEMTTSTEEEYAEMMRNGGRSPEGQRFINESSQKSGGA